MRRKLWVVGIGLSIAIAAVLLVRMVVHGYENAYAVWNVADWVIDYMESHDQQWPRNWNDLQAMYEARAGRDVSADMEHYRSLVEVDFGVDPRQLARQPFEPEQKNPPFEVIRYRRGPRYVLNEPNEMIWRYLNGVEYRATTRPIATAPDRHRARDERMRAGL